MKKGVFSVMVRRDSSQRLISSANFVVLALLATRQVRTTLAPLLRQRGTERRRLALLRTLRNRKDDSLRRPDPKAHRRRRARLVRHWSLQHRRRMLRQVCWIDRREGAGDLWCYSIRIYPRERHLRLRYSRCQLRRHRNHGEHSMCLPHRFVFRFPYLFRFLTFSRHRIHPQRQAPLYLRLAAQQRHLRAYSSLLVSSNDR